MGGLSPPVRGPQVRGSARSAGPQDRRSAGPAGPRSAGPAGRKPGGKLSYNEQREFDALPARIEALETEQRSLSAEMESPDFYKSGGERINVVMARLAVVGEELETLLSRWLELDERV